MATSSSPPIIEFSRTLRAVRAATPANVSGFRFFENFSGLNKDVTFGDAYNASIIQAKPITMVGSRTIVSLDDPIAGITETPPYAPLNSKIVEANPASGRTGNGLNCALSFRYSGTPVNTTGWSEQRWAMNPNFLEGAAGLTEFWMQYDEYIPSNFVHRDSTTIDDGRKILAFWADHYSTTDPADANYDPTLIVGGTGYTPAGSSSLGTRFDLAFTLPGVPDPAVTHFNFYGVRSNPPIPEANLILIHPDIDRGHWQRRTIHVRLPTAVNSNNGLIEFWVQRQRQTASPPAPEKLANWVNGDWYAEGQNYLNNGYLMGFSNAGFTEDTVFLITNWIISTSFADIDQTAIN
jgi:hypothetical protein